ncbi:MAG TPA: hypothetical protein VFO84_00300 [Dehalococcoidia bacterium]|nr:hypothetical protein [Dehalococcoidia bacterium]
MPTAKVGRRGRLEVRLDPDTERMLRVLEEEFGLRPSEITRHGIRLAYDEATRERRRAAARAINSAEIEDPPDPEELNRQLADRYGPLP